MKVKVKALNLLLYTICVIIIPTRADVQEIENQLAESNYHNLETTVLPVPLALQMVTTTEHTNEGEDSAAQVEIVDDTAEQSKPETVTIEANESQQESIAENAGKSTEVVSAVNSAGKEQNQEEAQRETIHNTGIEASEHEVGEAESLSQNIERNKTQEAAMEENPQDKETVKASAEEVAPDNGNTEPVASGAEEVEETQSKPETVDGEQDSVDYPADAPAMSENKEGEDVEKLPIPVEVNAEHKDASVENQNTNDSNNNETPDTDKAEESTANVQQLANSGAETVLTDKPEAISGSGKATKRPDSTVMHNTDSAGVTTAINAVSNIATNTLAPSLVDQILSCYTCTSTADAQCSAGPGKLINCQSMGNKPNGCYTLYKADTNITTRGCISQLTESGLKYCQSNVKQCILCHENSCNNLLAPSAAVKMSSMLSLWLGFGSFLCLKFLL